MNSKTRNNRILLSICIALFSFTTVIAQESLGEASSINDFSIDAIDYNPNGIKIYAFKNTLMLNFKEMVTDLKYEVINSKGKVLLGRKEVNDVQESILKKKS